MKRIHAGRCIEKAQRLFGVSNLKLASDMNVFHQQITRWRKSPDMKISKLQDFAEYFSMDFYEFLKLGEDDE
jgi:hypothetical protein